MEEVLESSYYKPFLGYNNVDWFTDEVIKLENEMTFYFENTKKDIIMTNKDEEDYRNKNVCRFCQKNYNSDKFRDHCSLTGDYRRSAHSKCNINVTKDQSNFIPLSFNISSNYDCHMFFRKLVDKKNGKLHLILYVKQMKNTIVLITVVLDLVIVIDFVVIY